MGWVRCVTFTVIAGDDAEAEAEAEIEAGFMDSVGSDGYLVLAI